MTKQEVQWASEHDWFISGNSQRIRVRESYSFEEEAVLDFTSFKELYYWAGY